MTSPPPSKRCRLSTEDWFLNHELSNKNIVCGDVSFPIHFFVIYRFKHLVDFCGDSDDKDPIEFNLTNAATMKRFLSFLYMHTYDDLDNNVDGLSTHSATSINCLINNFLLWGLASHFNIPELMSMSLSRFSKICKNISSCAPAELLTIVKELYGQQYDTFSSLGRHEIVGGKSQDKRSKMSSNNHLNQHHLKRSGSPAAWRSFSSIMATTTDDSDVEMDDNEAIETHVSKTLDFLRAEDDPNHRRTSHSSTAPDSPPSSKSVPAYPKSSSVSFSSTSVVDPQFRASVVDLAVRSIEAITANTDEAASGRHSITEYGSFIMDVLLAYSATNEGQVNKGDVGMISSWMAWPGRLAK